MTSETKKGEARKRQSMADYMCQFKAIAVGRKTSSHRKVFRIALLSSFTVTGLREVLAVQCHDQGLDADVYVAPYNQFTQEILDSGSALYRFEPHLNILYIDTMDFLGEDFFFPYRLTPEMRRQLADQKIRGLVSLVEKLAAQCPGKVIVHNFQVPVASPLGIQENRQEFGLLQMVRYMNDWMTEFFKENNQVFIFDYEGFCAKCGKARLIDPRMYYLGDIKLAFDYIPLLCESYLAYIKPMTARTRKCLVLDLDNTLWGGVVGEDGVEGIRLGPTPDGRPFLEFQKYVLNLYERGVILAINSSNNPKDVEKVFSDHPFMILKKEFFAASFINWEDKVSNMRRIAEAVNIGLDSLVFWDDLPENRELIRAALPEVLVPEVPEDPSGFLRAISELNDFNVLQLTEEDKIRNSSYHAGRQREERRKSMTDMTEYLKDLQIVVTVAAADPMTVPRISQLTQKTNQFNMTTRRYSEEDIQRFVGDPSFWVLSVRVQDRFGDSGITGALIVRKSKARWDIETFLLSCRVLGRRVEDAVLGLVAVSAIKAGASFLQGEFLPTAKNIPAKDFYKKKGFFLKEKIDQKEVWEIKAALAPKPPDYIEVVWKN